MTNRVLPAALILAAGLFTACNPLAALGDIPIGDDPLKLTDSKVSLALSPGAASATSVNAQAVGTANGTGSKVFTFADIDTSQFAALGNPTKLAQKINIKGVTLSGGANCTLPQSAQITIKTLKVDVTDPTTNTFGASATVDPFTITKTATGYAVSGLTPPTIAMTGNFAVLTSGGLNSATATVKADVTSDPSLEGCTMELVLEGKGATVKF